MLYHSSDATVLMHLELSRLNSNEQLIVSDLLPLSTVVGKEKLKSGHGVNNYTMWKYKEDGTIPGSSLKPYEATTSY